MIGFPTPKPEQEIWAPRGLLDCPLHNQEGETSLMLREDGREGGTMGASSGSPRREWVVGKVRRNADGASGPS